MEFQKISGKIDTFLKTCFGYLKDTNCRIECAYRTEQKDRMKNLRESGKRIASAEGARDDN